MTDAIAVEMTLGLSMVFLLWGTERSVYVSVG